MTEHRPSSILLICDFDPGFSGSKHHTTGVGGTEAMVVVLSEALAARGIQVTVATRGHDDVRGNVRYRPIGSGGFPDASITVLVKRWSELAAQAAGVRVFLATDVHVPEPDMIDRCLRWSTRSFALSPFMRATLEKVVRVPEMGILPPPISLADYSPIVDNRDPILL